MITTDAKFFDVLLTAAIRLHEVMIEEGTTTPAAIEALLIHLTPHLDSDERRFVLRLAAWVAAYTQHVIDEAMSDIIRAADPTLALGALSVQSRWAAFDLRVCRGEHPDDPDKDRLRNEEVEYFRAAVAGTPDFVFGRLFREQLATTPTTPPYEDYLA